MEKRLVYCLGDRERAEDINVVLKIMDSENDELIVMFIDALNGMRELMNCLVLW